MAKDDKPKEEPEKEVEEVKEESPADDTPQDDAPAEEPEVETPEEPEVEEAPAEEEKPSRREQLRVRDLLKKYPDLNKTPESKAPDFRDKVEADEDTRKILEETAKEYGQSQYNQGLEQAKTLNWRTNVRVDEMKVDQKFPDLDSETIEDLQDGYLAMVGYDPSTDSVRNPNISWADYVETQVNTANRIAGRKTAESSKNIAKQVAATGLRPDGSSAKGLDLSKSPKDMTDEELKEAARQEAKLYKK